jgi:hypothetical protein
MAKEQGVYVAIVAARSDGVLDMRQRNSLGVVSGLAFVAVFLVMLATFVQAARFVRSPFATAADDAYELAGDTRLVMIPAMHPKPGIVRTDWRAARWP